MAIFVAFKFKIDITISYSSKDKEMMTGNIKIYFFKNYKFCKKKIVADFCIYIFVKFKKIIFNDIFSWAT